MMNNQILPILLGLTSLVAFTPLHAHVVAEPQHVQAESYQKLAFKVTHGCEGSPTTAVTIHVPENLHGAKPMPKPGWKISMQIKPLSQPYHAHGRLITEEVRSITWEGGPLPNEYFDEFVIHAKLSSQPGPVVIPVSQVCQNGNLQWNETESPEKPRDKLEAPAPVIHVHPQESREQHQH